MLASLHWLPVKARVDFKVLLLTYKVLHGLASTYLSNLPYIPTRTLRSQDTGLLIVPRISKQTLEAGLSPIELHFYGMVCLPM